MIKRMYLIILHNKSYPHRIVCRANYFRKTGGQRKSEAPKQGHVKNFQNHEITGKDSYRFKATEVERKIREINLLIDLQTNLSSCRNSDHYFSLSLQRLSWDSLGTKNVLSTYAQNFWKVN